MRVVEQELNMVPDRPHPVVWLSQGDTGVTLVFTLVARNAVLTIEPGTTAQLRGTRADGTGYTKDVTLEENVATVECDENLTEIPGHGLFEISLTKNGKLLNSETFSINIEPMTLIVSE